MYEVDISDSQTCLDVDPERIEQIVRAVLAAEQVASATISVALVGNAAIHELNRRFLGHDEATDVLSFPLDDAPDAAPRGTGRRIDGEIVVSVEMACQQAAEFGCPAWNELVLYVVHGLLHLCGYDDLTADALPVMRRREQAVFQRLGLELPPRDPDDAGHVPAVPSAGEGSGSG